MGLPSRSGSSALILAPRGRDAAVAHALLQAAGIDSTICSSVLELQSALDDRASFAVVTEEALGPADLEAVANRLAAQPSWSDLPIIVLTHHGSEPERDRVAAQLSTLLGNVSFLERPFHPTTFVSLARTALKGRRRQYEARARIEELRESETRLRTALVAGRMAYWSWTPETDEVVASETMEDLFGLGAGEKWRSAQGFRLVHPDDRQQYQALVEASGSRGEGWHSEFRIIRPRDGKVVWLEERSEVARNPSMGKTRITGLVWDITERKCAEQALRRSEERLRRVLETDPVGVLFLNYEGRLIGANDVFLKMTGWSRSDLERRRPHWRSMTPPEWIAESEAQMKKLEATGYIGPYEKEYLLADGTRRWMLLAGRDLGDGTIAEYCIDITDRKDAEAALQRSETELAAELSDARTLQQLSTELIPEQNSEALYQSLLDAAIALMRADAGSLQMLDPDGSHLRLLASRNFDPVSEAQWRRVAVGSPTSCGQAPPRNERVIFEDVEASLAAWPQELAAFRSSGLRAAQSTPLVSRAGHLLGVLSTHWREPRSLKERHFDLFDVLARQAADLIERAQAESRLRESQERLQVLVGELQHRTRNLIGVVLAMVDMTVLASNTLDDFKVTFRERLTALV